MAVDSWQLTMEKNCQFLFKILELRQTLKCALLVVVINSRQNLPTVNRQLPTLLVGVARFELATSWSQTRRDDRTTLHPEYLIFNYQLPITNDQFSNSELAVGELKLKEQ